MAGLQGQLQLQRHLVLPAEWNIRKSHLFCELTSVCWCFEESLLQVCCDVKVGRGSGTPKSSCVALRNYCRYKDQVWRTGFYNWWDLALLCRMAGYKQWFATVLAENREQCVKVGSFKCCWYPRRVSGYQLMLMRGWQNVLGHCKAEVWK